MSALANELGRLDSFDDSEGGPELFDVNEALRKALSLKDGEEIIEIEAYNVRIVEARGRVSAFGKGALVVDFRLRGANGGTLPTKRLEIDDNNRPIPEPLITAFGAQAMREPTLERIVTSPPEQPKLVDADAPLAS